MAQANDNCCALHTAIPERRNPNTTLHFQTLSGTLSVQQSSSQALAGDTTGTTISSNVSSTAGNDTSSNHNSFCVSLPIAAPDDPLPCALGVEPGTCQLLPEHIKDNSKLQRLVAACAGRSLDAVQEVRWAVIICDLLPQLIRGGAHTNAATVYVCYCSVADGHARCVCTDAGNQMHLQVTQVPGEFDAANNAKAGLTYGHKYRGWPVCGDSYIAGLCINY